MSIIDPMPPAILLLSGGLDSATCLAEARANAFDLIYTLAFDYGQRHRHELSCAIKIATHYQVKEHRVVTIDLRAFGGSALTADIDVPKDQIIDAPTHRTPEHAITNKPLPITYVPARNTIFLSYALAWADVLGIDDVFIGVNALDFSGYPDCRPDYVAAFETMARLGTRRTQFRIHAPLVHLTKAQIIRRGLELGVDYAMTHSCYDPTPTGQACGHCDSCILRKRGFIDAGVSDPTVYA